MGGDLFDVIPLPDSRFAIILADVSGKGTPASLIATYGRDTLEEVFLDVVRGRAHQAHDRVERDKTAERQVS